MSFVQLLTMGLGDSGMTCDHREMAGVLNVFLRVFGTLERGHYVGGPLQGFQFAGWLIGRWQIDLWWGRSSLTLSR